MVPSLSVMKTNWLEQPKILPKKYRESSVCVAGGMKVILFSSFKVGCIFMCFSRTFSVPGSMGCCLLKHFYFL